MGQGSAVVRLYTVLLSTALIVAVGMFFWRLSGHWWFGVLGAWAMAANGVLIKESVRGLRLESFTLLFLAALAAWLWGRGWRGSFLLGVTIGMLALLRAPGLSITLPLLWSVWLLNLLRKRLGRSLIHPAQWRFSRLLLASVIGVGLFVPHLYGLHNVHGDPSWPSYGYARWLANVEFPERLGTPGFTTKEEFAETPYAGPKITYWQYMFGLHTLPELIFGQIKGWVESSGYMATTLVPGAVNAASQFVKVVGASAALGDIPSGVLIGIGVCLLLTFIGWVNLLQERNLWWVPLLSLWGTWYAAYLYSVRLVEPFRHTGHVYPLLLFCLLWGGWQFYSAVVQRYRITMHRQRSDSAVW